MYIYIYYIFEKKKAIQPKSTFFEKKGLSIKGTEKYNSVYF